MCVLPAHFTLYIVCVRKAGLASHGTCEQPQNYHNTHVPYNDVTISGHWNHIFLYVSFRAFRGLFRPYPSRTGTHRKKAKFFVTQTKDYQPLNRSNSHLTHLPQNRMVCTCREAWQTVPHFLSPERLQSIFRLPRRNGSNSRTFFPACTQAKNGPELKNGCKALKNGSVRCSQFWLKHVRQRYISPPNHNPDVSRNRAIEGLPREGGVNRSLQLGKGGYLLAQGDWRGTTTAAFEDIRFISDWSIHCTIRCRRAKEIITPGGVYLLRIAFPFVTHSTD